MTTAGKYALLREAALRVVEGRSDAMGADFMSDILLALTEREQLLEALRPFSEGHAMGDNYVQFHPRLIAAARAAVTKAIHPDKTGTFADPERLRAWEEAGRRIQAEDEGLAGKATATVASKVKPK